MNIITQNSQRCAVTCPINVLSTSIHSKQRKIQQAPQCVQSNTAISLGGGLSVTYLLLDLSFNCCGHITATQYTDIPLSTSTAMLTYTSVFNCLLRSPPKTHVLPLTAFHSYIYSYHFWRFTLFKPGKSLSLHPPFLCLGSQYEG